VSPRVLVACDLDRTLIYSARSAALPPGFDRPVVCVERYADADQSFVTAAALAGLVELSARAEFVPATTRTRAQAERVRFPGVGVPRYQIVANGGCVLVDGEPDAGWARAVERAARADGAAPVGDVWREVLAWEREPWLLRPHRADDFFCYAIVDRSLLPEERLAEIGAWSAARGWLTSVQGRKLYVVPRSLSKAAAAAEVARRAGADLVLAAGDSLLDRPLLQFADAAVRPGHGELATLDWTAPHLDVVAESGMLAGERIVEWLLARTGRAVPAPTP